MTENGFLRKKCSKYTLEIRALPPAPPGCRKTIQKGAAVFPPETRKIWRYTVSPPPTHPPSQKNTTTHRKGVREVTAFPPLQTEGKVAAAGERIRLPAGPAPAAPARSPVSHGLRGSGGVASEQRGAPASCPEGPTLPAPGEPSQLKPTHPLPIQWKGDEQRDGGTPAAAVFRAEGSPQRQAPSLAVPAAGRGLGGGAERGGGFPDSGRTGGRTSSSSATAHFQPSAPRGPSTGGWIRCAPRPSIAPKGKLISCSFLQAPQQLAPRDLPARGRTLVSRRICCLSCRPPPFKTGFS